MAKEKILILANNDVGLYKFRKELLEQLQIQKYKVYISLPDGEFVEELKSMGCIFIDTPIDRRGTNPIRDLGLLRKYKKIIRDINPKYIFTYTIKPNIYGGIIAAKEGISYFPNVTGLGTSLENNGFLSKIILLLYRYAFRKARTVFFQNTSNQNFFEKHKIARGKHKLLPGSGVNLEYYDFQDYPESENIKFAFIARIMKEKGAGEFLEAAKLIKQQYSNVQFHVCGFCEDSYENILEQLQQDGVIIYHGMVKDIRTVLKDMHCVILPSYHEGLSNVLLEAGALGRPLIAANVPGCRETFENNIGGFLVAVRSSQDLMKKIELFLNLPFEKKRDMGIEARKYVQRYFNRQIVIDAYLSELNGAEAKE